MRAVLGAILIAGISFLVYFPSLQGGFIFDDDIYLTNAAHIQASDGLYRIWCTSEAADYYPVTNTALWLEWRLWGMNSTGYHVTNLVFHIVDCLLVWMLLERLAIPGAFLAAILLAVHPVNVEAVAWIAQLKELLAAFFFVLSILWFLREDEGQELEDKRTQSLPVALNLGRWYWLSLLAFILAIFSKGTVVVLPLILLLMIWWRRRVIDGFDLRRCAPFFLIAVVMTPIIMWFVMHSTGEIRHVTMLQRSLGAASAIWFYLSKAIMPVNLIFTYTQWQIQTSDLMWWLPLLAACITTLFLWRCEPKAIWVRAIFFAWACFCVALVPVMGFTDTGYMQFSLVADHYQHIAMIAVAALVAAAWSTWRRQMHGAMSSMAVAAASFIVVALSLTTFQQNHLYADAIFLYRATLEKNPNSWITHINLAQALVEKGALQDAIALYQKTLELWPDNRVAHNNLADALVETGQLPDAVKQSQETLQRWPEYPNAHVTMGNAMLKLSRPQEAIKQYRQALQLKPDYAEAHYNLARALIQVNEPREAIEHCQRALYLKPNYADAHYDLANAFAQSNQPSRAIDEYRQALKLRPNHVWTHNNLGVVLAETGHVQEAIEQFQQAVQLQADFIDAWMNLTRAYVKMGRTAEAVAAAQTVLKLARAQGNLELVKEVEGWLSVNRSLTEWNKATLPPSQSEPPQK